MANLEEKSMSAPVISLKDFKASPGPDDVTRALGTPLLKFLDTPLSTTQVALNTLLRLLHLVPAVTSFFL